MPRIHHQAKISWRAIMWPLRVKVAGFGLLARKRADDAHSAEGFGGMGVHRLAGAADVAEDRTNSADPGPVREPDRRQQHQRTEQQLPIDEGEDRQAAEQLNDGAPRVVDHGEDAGRRRRRRLRAGSTRRRRTSVRTPDAAAGGRRGRRRFSRTEPARAWSCAWSASGSRG